MGRDTRVCRVGIATGSGHFPSLEAKFVARAQTHNCRLSRALSHVHTVTTSCQFPVLQSPHSDGPDLQIRKRSFTPTTTSPFLRPRAPSPKQLVRPPLPLLPR